MNNNYEKFRKEAFSALRGLAKECPEFSDAEMLVASAETTASLKRNTVHKNIDIEWIEKIEAALPYIDTIVRFPKVAIEDVDEILPVELSRHITEKTIKHLAQHTNLILDITEDGDVIPQKLLNVFHDETVLTYENKFINTLLARLSAFVDKRYKALMGTNAVERNYKFNYHTEFEHFAGTDDEGGRNTARIDLRIELTSPLKTELSELDSELSEQYNATLARLKKINHAIISFMSSPFIRAMGRNYIRPPVIRTNAILKNKNFRECLNLWEFIESFDKTGFYFVNDEYSEMPSSNYISDLYSSVAMQYTHFYNGVAENPEDNRLLSKKHLQETYPEFDPDFEIEELDDYMVYDSEYKKLVPVSRLMNNRKKLSEDEKRIRMAIVVALRADEEMNAERLRREAEYRRLEKERRQREEEEARRRAEEEARRLAEEEARRLAEEEARRLAEEEARRLAEAAKAPVEIRYRRSFMSRLIQAEPPLQDYYTEIKNELLSYRGVKSKVSWKCETYKKTKVQIAKIDVKGKTLYVYLALEPENYKDSKYFFTNVANKPGYGETPMLLKVKSERGKNHAIELIRELMQNLGIERFEREWEDFHLPYEETDALIERGLIKVIVPAGVELREGDETVKTNLDFLDEYKDKEKDAAASEGADVPATAEPEISEEPVAEEASEPTEEAPVEVTAEEALAEEAAETEAPAEEPELTLDDALKLIAGEEVIPEPVVSEATPEAVAEESEAPVEIRYRRSFLSRLIQSDDELKDYYSDIKNELLSYTGVKCKISWKCETYKKTKVQIAKIDVKGKMLYLYLALDPDEYTDSKYFFTNVKDKPGFAENPMLLKVKSGRGRNHAIELIRELMQKLEIERIDREPENFRMPYEDTDALVERGLIKVLLPKGVTLDEDDKTVLTDVEALLAGLRRPEDKEKPAHVPTVEVKDDGATVVVTVHDEAEADVVREALDVIEGTGLSSSGRRVIIVDANGTPIVRRKDYGEDEMDFAFSDTEGAPRSALIIPYTRAQYLALPRKKKKSVLMNVKKLLEYRKIKRYRNALISLHSSNERIIERIAKLDERLALAAKFLPDSKLWEKCVFGVKG
ncbi:MAG: DUF2357 domain-containing protein [Clostridia bacterium]|nr:DUF2357 domain-containing protein [Clostridia bacterium]